MKLKYTILYVPDVKETLTFYERAFGLSRGMIHEGGDYGELETGETTLAFSSIDLMNQIGKNAVSPNRKKPTFEIAFETENVAQSLKTALNAGAILIQDAAEMPWGQTTSYVQDLNGFLVEICSPVQSGS